MASVTLPVPEELLAPQAKVLIDVPEPEKKEEEKKEEELPALETAEAEGKGKEEEEEEEEEKEPGIPAEEAAQIVKDLHSAETTETKSAAAEKIGDLARIEANRAIFGAAGAIEAATADLLSCGEQWNFRRLLLRAIGNLLYENKENREKVASLEGGKVVDEIVSSLADPAPNDVKKTASGVITNLAFESPDIQMTLVTKGVVKRLLHILNEFSSNTEGKDETLVCMVCKAICNLASSYAKEGDSSQESDEMARTIGREGATGPLVALLKCGNFAVRSEALQALVGLAAHSENYIRLISEGGLERLLVIIKDVEEDEDLRKSAVEFLITLTEDENIRIHFGAVLDDIIQYILNTPEPQPAEGEEAKKTSIWGQLVKALGFLSAHEPFDDKLWEKRKALFDLGQSKDCDVKVGVGMILGNLARSDSHCITLLQENALQLIKEFLAVADGRVQHLALGAIRNLSVPVPNRRLIAESGVITACASLLDSRNAHVLFLNLGVLRTLILQSAATATAFVEAEGVDKLMIFFSQDLADEHVRLRYESGRVLAALIVRLPDPDIVVQKGGVKSVVFLVQSTYLILQVEGMQALQVLVQKDSYRTLVSEAGAPEAITKLLDTADQTLLTLLVRVTKKLTENPGPIREEFAKVSAAEKLQKVLDTSTDGTLKALIQGTFKQLSEN